VISILGWSLLHFVWQGAAVAALLASLNLLARRAAPQVRYLLASGALLVMLVLPLATFRSLRSAAVGAEATAASPAGKWLHSTRITSLRPAAASSPDAPRAVGMLRRGLEPFLPSLVGLWGAGVLLLSLRALGGWALVQRLRRSGLRTAPPAIDEALVRLVGVLRISAPVRLYESALVQVPTAIGWLRPIILLPASALTGLSATQIEMILAHELAHIRRADYLVNLLQTAVETLLFYHPAVWWVSHRMRVEREHCCDDLAVAAGGNAVRYARALADLEGLCADAPALAMAATGGSLLERVARLLGPSQQLSRPSRGLGATLCLVSLALALGVGPSLLGGESKGGAAPISSPRTEESGSTAAPTKVATAPVPKEETKPTPAARPRPQAAAAPHPEPRAFPLERVLEMANAGVTPEYIDGMDALGYSSLSVEQLVALRSQGVGPEYVHGLAAEGFKGLTPDQLLSLRSQGVSAEFVRGLKEQGLASLSMSNLIELRSQGVSPEFVAGMKRAGYDELSVSRLIELRSQGVSPEFAAELKALGYEKLSLSKLIGLRSMGVTPGFIRGLKEAGYQGLSAGLLIELRSNGVTPEFARELKEAGFANLKVEELIELRRSGVRGELLKRLKGR
jgi:beta-lactamase regulating signal transducer with metallopeptidase domain